jgi:hypothetical protein
MDVLGLLSNPSSKPHAHPYASSISSSASSSSSSVFSLDAQSSVSSTTTNPVDVIWENDEAQLGRTSGGSRAFGKVVPTKDAAVPPELRMHPRRTNSVATSGPGARPPPCLLRQSERKVNFVDNLVGESYITLLYLVHPRLRPNQKIRHPRLLRTSGRCRPQHPAVMPRPVQKGFFPCGRLSKKRSVARVLATALCRWHSTI